MAVLTHKATEFELFVAITTLLSVAVARATFS